MPTIRTEAELWKVVRVFHSLAPTAHYASDEPALWNVARDLALDTLRHETGFHITPVRGLA